MGKRVPHVLDLPSSGGTAILLILSASFLLGGFAGCVLANQVSGDGGVALGEYLEGYLSIAYSGGVTQPGPLTLLWEIFRWPLFAFVFGLTPLGLLGIPILFLVRGFLLSFAIASFFRVLGAVGLALSFIVFGLTGLLCFPVLFFLGIQSFFMSGVFAGCLIGESKKLSFVNRATLLRCGLCAAVLCVCFLIEYQVIPVLMESFAAFVQ